MGLPKACVKQLNHGFTVAEAIVVMGLLALAGSWGLFSGTETYRGNLFGRDCDMVIASLQRARNLAVDNVCLGSECINGKPHGVHFDPTENKIVIFQGDDYAGRDQLADEIIEFESKTVYVDDPIGPDVIFDRLSGDSIFQSVILKNGFGQVATIMVNNVGRIDWQ